MKIPDELLPLLQELADLHHAAIGDDHATLRWSDGVDKSKPVVAVGKSVRFQPAEGYGYGGTIFHGGICNTLGDRSVPAAESLAHARAKFIAAAFNFLTQLSPLIPE